MYRYVWYGIDVREDDALPRPINIRFTYCTVCMYSVWQVCNFPPPLTVQTVFFPSIFCLNRVGARTPGVPVPAVLGHARLARDEVPGRRLVRRGYLRDQGTRAQIRG